MLIHVIAKFEHYLRHVKPIADELARRGHEVESYGIDGHRPWGPPLTARRARADVTIAASYDDARKVRAGRIVYVEHGVGQTYGGRPDSLDAPGWPGCPGLGYVDLFLAPSQRVADAWAARYPDARAVAVGCPLIDPFTSKNRVGMTSSLNVRPLAVLSFRWHCDVAPEAASALPHYEPFLPDLVAGLRARGFDVWGHGHPRMQRRLARTWNDAGVRFATHWPTIAASANLFIADNTSALYEFAATGKPVLALNAPWYDRDIEHGLRFWSHVPGLMVDEPIDVAAAADLAITDGPDLRALRSRAVRAAYVAVDGRAAERAADAIEELTDGT